jgi:hypothetical protein
VDEKWAKFVAVEALNYLTAQVKVIIFFLGCIRIPMNTIEGTEFVNFVFDMAKLDYFELDFG